MANDSLGADGFYRPFVLAVGQAIHFPGGVLYMQHDGPLVNYQGTNPFWAASFSSRLDGLPLSFQNCEDCYATFQSDGNLVLYRPSGAY